MIVASHRPPVVFGMGQDATADVIIPPAARLDAAVQWFKYGALALGAFLIWGVIKRGR